MNWDYLAGFFDGEGGTSISLGKGKYKDKMYYWPRIQLTMSNTDEKILQAIGEFLHSQGISCSMYCQDTRLMQTVTVAYSRKEIYNLKIYSHEAIEKFVAEIGSRVISKSENFKVLTKALEFISTARNGKRHWTPDLIMEFNEKFIQKHIPLIHPSRPHVEII